MKIKYKNNIFDLSIPLNNGSNSFEIKKLAANSFILSGQSGKKNAFAAEDDNNIYVSLDGESFTFEKIKEEEKSYDSSSSANENKCIVKPPMPGSIVKILVEMGQLVSEGDGLVIVEAMKMETTLYSSIDGNVTEINCTTGEQVDSDRILVVVEKEVMS